MYLFYLFAWKLIGVLPEKSAYKLSKVISDRIYRKNGKGVKRLRGDYRREMPNMSESELITLLSEILLYIRNSDILLADKELGQLIDDLDDKGIK